MSLFPRRRTTPDRATTPGRRRRWSPMPQALTDVHQPDDIQLLAHTPTTTISTQADLELQVHQLIEELFTQGAIDRYTGHALDAYIDSRIAADLELIDREAAAATATNGGLLLSAEIGNLTEATTRLQLLREADRELSADIHTHRTHLRGGQPVLPDRLPAPLPHLPLAQAPDLTAFRPAPTQSAPSN